MSTIKSVALFCAKSAAFTIIFWGLWIGVLRPIGSHQSQSDASSTQDAQTKTQTETYDKQFARVNQQLDVVEGQQKRMDKNLSAQEENTKRFDAVLTIWEKQAGLKK